MTELERLVHTTSSPTLREALRAGISEAPRPELLATVHSAVKGGCIVPALALSAQAAGGAAPAATVALAAEAAGAAFVLKPLLVGLVGGVLFCGAVATLEPSPSPRHEQAALSTRAPSLTAHGPAARRGNAPAVSERAPASAVGTQETSPGFDDRSVTSAAQGLAAQAKPAINRAAGGAERATQKLAGAPSLGPAAVVPALPPETGNGAALRVEIEQIDRVRRALAQGDAEQARAALATYDATSKLRVLGREALLLRIETARLRGDGEGACRLVERYLSEAPNDPQALRLRQMPCTASR